MKTKKASIDIGSNSILLLVGDFSNGEYRELANESNVTGLGRELDKSNKFLDISMEESLEVLKNYAQIVQKYGIKPEEVLVTATEAARVALNAQEFFEKVRKETNLSTVIISGKGEAYFSTKGILFNSHFEQDTLTIMDIGGASTELIKVKPKTMEILKDFSMPFGAVRLTNWIQEKSVQEKLDSIQDQFKKELEAVKTNHLHCVAGTMTSVANMYLGHKEFKEKKIHGLSFKTSEVYKMKEKFNYFTPEQFLELFPFLGKRAKSIRGGLEVATTIFDWLDIKDVEISTYGLRYGTLEEGIIPDEYIIRRF